MHTKADNSLSRDMPLKTNGRQLLLSSRNSALWMLASPGMQTGCGVAACRTSLEETDKGQESLAGKLYVWRCVKRKSQGLWIKLWWLGDWGGSLIAIACLDPLESAMSSSKVAKANLSSWLLSSLLQPLGHQSISNKPWSGFSKTTPGCWVSPCSISFALQISNPCIFMPLAKLRMQCTLEKHFCHMTPLGRIFLEKFMWT